MPHWNFLIATMWPLFSLELITINFRLHKPRDIRKEKMLPFRLELSYMCLKSLSQEFASLTVRLRTSILTWRWWWVKDGHLFSPMQYYRQLVDQTVSLRRPMQQLKMEKSLLQAHVSTKPLMLKLRRKERNKSCLFFSKSLFSSSANSRHIFDIKFSFLKLIMRK